MPASVIDGKAIALEIQGEVAEQIKSRVAAGLRPPGLATILVGDDGASRIYVRNKRRACDAAGIRSFDHDLPGNTPQQALLELIDELNTNDDVDGILVQSPLPSGMGRDAEPRVFGTIDPDKDVDGFHAVNVGRLVQREPGLAPCTPSGIVEMLDQYEIPIEGRHAVVIGRSDIVGKPMAMLLLHRSATVTICHSRTVDLPGVAAAADILVAAIGRPGFVSRDFVKPGATVIDVGTTYVSDRDEVVALFGADSPRLEVLERRGRTVVGDVHPEVEEIAGALTPVPGGVGPLTISMLLSNTVRAAELRRARPDVGDRGAVRAE